jgi:hypothetical protein
VLRILHGLHSCKRQVQLLPIHRAQNSSLSQCTVGSTYHNSKMSRTGLQYLAKRNTCSIHGYRTPNTVADIFMGVGPRLKKHTYSNGRQAGEGRGWYDLRYHQAAKVSLQYPTTKQLGISSPSNDIFAKIPIMLSAPLFDSLRNTLGPMV